MNSIYLDRKVRDILSLSLSLSLPLFLSFSSSPSHRCIHSYVYSDTQKRLYLCTVIFNMLSHKPLSCFFALSSLFFFRFLHETFPSFPPLFMRPSLINSSISIFAVTNRELLDQDELENQNAVFLKNHPEVQQIASDFLLHLLHRKPEDVFAEAADYFSGLPNHHFTSAHHEIAHKTVVGETGPSHNS